MKKAVLLLKKPLNFAGAAMILLCVFLAVVFFLPKGMQNLAYAAVNDNVPFETWQGYDTDPGRFGNPDETQLDLMKTWTQNAVSIVEMGEPINEGRTQSLKIGSGNAEVWTPFYGRGDFGARLDQTGAKYVQIHIKNLSGAAKEFGIFLSDVSQELIDNPPTSNAQDFGYEHWGLKWNAKAMLVDSAGTKSVAVSDAGLGVLIPKDFQGTINIAINKQTLERPGWLVAQGNEWLNNEIDIDKCFSIDPVIPAGNPNSLFLVGDVYLKSDSVLDDFMHEVNQEEQETAKDVIKPTDGDITVDYTNNTIILKNNIDFATFRNSFLVLDDWTMEISDPNGFLLYNDEDIVEDGCKVIFSNGELHFEYEIAVESGQGGGCQSSVTATSYLLPLGMIALFIKKKS